MDKSNTKMYISQFGTKIYRNSKGEIHKLDGPAIEWKNGDKYWYKEGKMHRLDGPAREYANGSKYWYILDSDLEEKEFNSWMNRIQRYI